MKNNLLPALAATLLALGSSARLAAQPLAAPAAVRAKPDAASPAIATLPAGVELFTAVGITAPTGWLAVALPGPHAVFVKNGDLAKDLSVRAGSSYLLAPSADAPVLATADKDDKTVITSIAGKFTGISLDRTLVGYIAASAVSRAEPPPPAPTTVTVVTPRAAPPPPRDLATSPATTSQPNPPSATAELPRLFQGTLASTRAPLRPRRPYDYELRDTNGNRFAYLDTSRLIAPATVEIFLDRVVVVYGVARAVPGSPDMVVAAENISAR